MTLEAHQALAVAREYQRSHPFSATLLDEPRPVYHAAFAPLGGPAWEVFATSPPATAADWAIAVIVDDAAAAVAYRRLTTPGQPPGPPRRTLAEVVAVARAYMESHIKSATLPAVDRQVTFYQSFHGVEGPAWEVVVRLPPSNFEGTGTNSIVVSDDDGTVATIINSSGFESRPVGRPAPRVGRPVVPPARSGSRSAAMLIGCGLLIVVAAVLHVWRDRHNRDTARAEELRQDIKRSLERNIEAARRR